MFEVTIKKLQIPCPACTVNSTGTQKKLGGYDLMVCQNCGLWFCNPSELPDVNYDDVYETEEYQKLHFGSLDNTKDWTEFKKYSTYKPFFLNVPIRPKGTLLDVGCGVGRFCRAAYTDGWKVKGIDISEKAIEKGLEMAPFPMMRGNVQDLIKTGERFNVVTAFEVLEHLPTPIDFVRTIKELVKPDGNFFCTVPNIDSTSVQRSTRPDWIPPVHVLFFTQMALRELLKRAGFREVLTGIIWVNTPPENAGLEFFKYYLRRLLRQKSTEPDPLGLWAMGSK